MKSHARNGDRTTAATGHPTAHTTAARTAFAVSGIPRSADAVEAGLLRTRLIAAAKAFSVSHGPRPLTVTLTNRPQPADEYGPVSDPGPERDEPSTAERAQRYTATAPLHTFDRLVLPEETLDHLLRAVHTVEQRGVLFDDWGLRSIQPHPSSAVNLEGVPGTGKTLAAHAIADRLGRPVIAARGSQLESKFHGEGPKNLAALFHAARDQGAVLFLDEADSLMSARFETTTHGSEHAVNAMRSEMLTALDSHEGLVVFATNLVTAYDTAFDSRVWHVRFPRPDRAARAEIWRRHLPEALPRDNTVAPEALAEVDDVTGRDICRAVIDAAAEVLRSGRTRVGQEDLFAAVERIKAGRPRRGEPEPEPSPAPAPAAIAEAVARAVPPPAEGGE
ncbi:ATP-binding protein [Streptomyces coffeae]|uniref:ATP-binding protein n=1 Tax=Streptomyces coffeae TaxID=621382 RepID=UPI0027DB33E7|nr:ATP-binding protein [Streptomyces coffeae]